MIVELISQYLKTHKRLVVPNLGTFIVKVAGESVLFSNLIKNDDGVLRSLIVGTGVSELEAAGAIDRFVFEVQFRLQNNSVCMLNGFGELHSGANGSVTFDYKPSIQEGELESVTSGGHEGVNSQTERTVSADTNVADETDEEVLVNDDNRLKSEPYGAHAADVAVAERVSVESASNYESEPVDDSESTDHTDTDTRSRTERVRAVYEQPHITASPAKRPADYVKGLRYGKGRKVVSGSEYATMRSRRRNDRIMIIAIVAASLAIAALAYGLWCDRRAARMDAEIYGEPQTEAETEIRNPDLDYIEPNKN